MSHASKLPLGKKVRLQEIDPDHHDGLTREEANEKTERLGAELADLLELMYAAGNHGLLVVVQGRDTAGKDGTIKRILDYANVQSTRVASFKVPTPEELSHDFLWRVHSKVPGKGGVTIFNRSHYEDVLVVRVHNLAPEKIWKGRYDHINAFESLLAQSSTIIVKFMLHISKAEQKQRLMDREAEPEKSWKLNVGDWKEREFWDDYEEAYEDALEKCNAEHAPWIVIPANHKWFRDLAVIETLVEMLRPYRDGWRDSLTELGEKVKAELAAYRAANP